MKGQAKLSKLLLERTEGYEFVSLTGDFLEASKDLHSHVIFRGDCFPDGEEVSVRNSFLTFRPVPIPEGDFEIQNATAAFEAYVVRIGNEAMTFDTGCLLLEVS